MGPELVSSLLVYFLLVPIGLYLLIQFWICRSHFVIQRRLPRYSTFLAVFPIIVTSICQVLYGLSYIKNAQLFNTLFDIVYQCGLYTELSIVLYRAYIAYNKLKHASKSLQRKMHNNMKLSSSQRLPRCSLFHCFSLYTLSACALISFSSLIGGCSHCPYITLGIWSLLVVAGLVVLVVVKDAKDILGTIIETRVTIIIILLDAITINVLIKFNLVDDLFFPTIKLFILLLVGNFNLIIPLLIIRKAEMSARRKRRDDVKTSLASTKELFQISSNALHQGAATNLFQSPVRSVQSVQSPRRSDTSNIRISTGLQSVNDLQASETTSSPQSTPSRTYPEKTEKSETTLDMFLARSIENHEKFSHFLASCYALENLLFVEQTVILYQSIHKYYFQGASSATTAAELAAAPTDVISKQSPVSDVEVHVTEPRQRRCPNAGGELKQIRTPKVLSITDVSINLEPECSVNRHRGLQIVYDIKFKHLTKIYQAFEEIIESYVVPVDIKSDGLKRDLKPLWLISKSIYNQFIASGSRDQVNLPHATYKELRKIFESEHDAYNHPKLRSHLDYCHVFEKAMFEVWKILNIIFNLQFKSMDS